MPITLLFSPLAARLSIRPQWVLGLMLLALHASLAWGIDSPWSGAFLLVHFGLFLMWQPIWRGERKLGALDTALVVGIAILLVEWNKLLEAWNRWWLMAFWLALLFSLIGGSVPGVHEKRQRLVALLGALYLLGMLLIWVVPQLFEQPELTAEMTFRVRYGLALLPPLIFAVRIEPRQVPAPLAIDLIYSLILFLLVAALVLGSFVVRMLSHGEYPIALAQTLFVIALLLVALSWLWNPHAGFSGVGQLLSRYLLSIGLPFEHWMRNLANMAEQEAQPGRFLQLALADLATLPWVTGVEWRTPRAGGEMGARSPHFAEFNSRDLTLIVYTRWSASPALKLHMSLLTRLLGYFYDAKRREELERHNAYTQAISDTGARLTHDVKNLLQSLRSLCAAAQSADTAQAVAFQALVKRQLPQITERLQNALDKLKAQQMPAASLTNATAWWDALQARYPQTNVRFSACTDVARIQIPTELFDSVADNLLQNAFAKSKSAPTMIIEVQLASGPTLRVCDSGDAISPERAVSLFEAPVESGTGLGIGLFQAGRQARQLGYRLFIASNEPGRVCFELSKSQ